MSLKCRGLAWPLLSEGAEAQKLGLVESWGAEGCELGLLGLRLGAWHWGVGGWVGRPLIDFCLPAVPAGGRANRAPSINRLEASLIKTFYS